jgi:hypothetical protein
MLNVVRSRPAMNLTERGYHAMYRPNETNHCPGCGRTHWIIGRITAECAFCATALEIQDSRRGQQATVLGWRGSRNG